MKCVEPRPVHIVHNCRSSLRASAVTLAEEWEPCALLYLASANTALNRDLNSCSWRYIRRALWIFPSRETHGRQRCDSLNKRPGLITFIERKQFRDLSRLLNPANLRRSCSSVVFLRSGLYCAPVCNRFCAVDLATCSRVCLLIAAGGTLSVHIVLKFVVRDYELCNEGRFV